MSDLNMTIVSGRLTRDPELRHTASGQAVTQFTMASNRIWKNTAGKQEETIFIDVVVWGKQAETVSNILRKGRYAMVTGRLKQDNWEHEGQRRSKIVINADKVDLPPKEYEHATARAVSEREPEVNFDDVPLDESEHPF